jgi:hypothetical protein
LILTNSGTASFNFTTGNTVTGARFGKPNSTDTCAGSLATGASCTIAVTFSPNSTAARAGTLTVQDNAAPHPVVMLMGN